ARERGAPGRRGSGPRGVCAAAGAPGWARGRRLAALRRRVWLARAGFAAGGPRHPTLTRAHHRAVERGVGGQKGLARVDKTEGEVKTARRFERVAPEPRRAVGRGMGEGGAHEFL